MAQTDQADLVVHVLRIKGIGDADTIAIAIDLDEASVQKSLDELASSGLVQRRDAGRIHGWSLTAQGRDHHAAAVAPDLIPTSGQDALRGAYTEFVALNEPFKRVCTDQQLGRLSGHGDVLAQLRPIHERTLEMLATATAADPRFAAYGTRFSDAWRRLSDGDMGALTKPLAASYHDTWMELHQDMLLSLGIERSDADGV